MQRLISLCLWQVVIVGILWGTTPNIAAEEAGIRIRGPKSTDVFPYDRYGPINSNDTLWKIALTVRPDNTVTVYQVMQSLFQLNPQAFVDGNLNHLVSGQYLRIPSILEIRSINSDLAKQKSENDDKIWQKKLPKTQKAEEVAKVIPPEEKTVRKKDLDAAKTEINDQLQTFDTEQQARLETIQNDVLDSIDGLQAILKENESLKNKLGDFNEQLTTMQEEVAKEEDIKLQMNTMLQIQQELLDKAEAREKELLLEKQKAELAADDFTKSLWFKILIATIPGLMVVGGVVFFIARKKKSKEQEPKESSATTDVVKETPQTTDAVEDLDSLDSELSLDEDLSLDDALSIDLSEDDDDLFSDDLDSLDDELLNDELSDDDVIHLDDDLDELDDLEDISLDDDSDDALDDLLSSEDETEIELESELESEPESVPEPEPEPLEGGQLGQDDLNDLLAGLDTDEDDEPGEALDGGELGQGDLDALLSGDIETEEASNEQPDGEDVVDVGQIEDGADVTDPDDIDALLNSVAEESAPTADDIAEDGADVTDPDDIDALLNSVAAESTPTADDIAEDGADVTDPDDIDALLNSVAAESTPTADDIAEDGADVTDPDDIDALLNSVAAESTPTADDIAEDGADVTDPDDIDALLNSVAAESTPKADDIAEDGADVTDPDDIDALLNSVTAESTPTADDIAEDGADVTDPDDIDALLNSVTAASTPTADDIAEDGADVTDPDDIDALLNSVTAESTPASDDIVEDSVDITDPDDIDALLNSVAAESSPLEDDNVATEKEDDVTAADEANIENDNENKALIENFTDDYVAPFLSMDFSDIGKDTSTDSEADESSNVQTDETLAEEVVVDDEPLSDELEDEPADVISDDFDIDSLISDVQDTDGNDNETMDIGDDLLGISELASIDENNSAIDQEAEGLDEDTLAALDTDFDESTLSELLQDEKSSDTVIELSPDFTDSNVLADLLAEDTTVKADVTEATEINDIQELDSLDFDELLANIEEESTTSPNDDFDLAESIDIDDNEDLEEIAIEDHGKSVETEEDFISVDSLLSDSLDSDAPEEPYEHTSIDVGLNEFPEFAGNMGDFDGDDDDNGVSAKLDLAKVYLEIGDKDNAEIILQDVVNMGDAQQQYEAQQLLDSLE